MPNVRLLSAIASPTVSYVPGDVIEVAQDEAGRLIAAGIAEAVHDVRTASAQMDKVENTSKKLGKK